jgi:two-component system nitrogen regulation response regulator NtrX
LLVVERALEATTLRRENRRLRAQTHRPLSGLIGRSAAAQQLRNMIGKLAQANSRVLISGPAGAGKETVARLIHDRQRCGRATSSSPSAPPA